MTELIARGTQRVVDGEGRPIAEFGNQRVMMIPRNVINVLPQIRSEFDPHKLQELADSMPLADDVEGLMHELMQPVTEGLHDEESALRYLEQYNLANGTDYSLEDLVPFRTVVGTRYDIHIAGERRLLAADILIERHGYSPESLILSTVDENISYIDALPKQFVENNARENPSAEDEARAMRRYIDMMRVIESKYTQADCARAFAVNPDKVREAIIFTDYPPSMQQLVRNYPFSWVIEAKDIYEEWLQYYQEHKLHLKSSDDVDLFADDGLTVGVSENGATTWTASDGTTFFESPEDVATYEVETCFTRIVAERLARRTAQGGRRNRDVRLKSQLVAIRESLQNEARGTEELALPYEPPTDDYQEVDSVDAVRELNLYEQAAWDHEQRIRELAERFNTRRKLASSSLFEASLRALSLLDMRGDLTRDMRVRLGKYGVQMQFAQPEIGEEDIAFSDHSLAPAS